MNKMAPPKSMGITNPYKPRKHLKKRHIRVNLIEAQRSIHKVSCCKIIIFFVPVTTMWIRVNYLKCKKVLQMCHICDVNQ